MPSKASHKTAHEKVHTRSHVSEELEAALEDVRQVRSYVDRLRMSHPIRGVIQPLNRLALALAPIFMVFGIGMQWLLDSPMSSLWGVSKVVWVSSITGVLLLASSVAKYVIFSRSSQSSGYPYSSLLRRMLLGDGYLRILGSMLTILVVMSVVVIQLGQAHMIVSLIGLYSGAILVMLPLAIPLPEFTRLGIGMLIVSSVALFVFPGYPFYKVAILFGLLCLLMGLTKFQEEPDELEENRLPQLTVFGSAQEESSVQSETKT